MVHSAHEAAYAGAVTALESNEVWRQIGTAEQEKILAAVGLSAPLKPDVSTDLMLLTHLDGRPLAAGRTEIDAVPGRVQEAIRRAAERFEPNVRTIMLERATLRSEDEVSVWLDRQRARLLDAVRQGPVLIG